MDKKINFDKKYFQSNNKKKQNAIKSINNYLKQLQMHFELTDTELEDILNDIYAQYKISSKKWWSFFK